jgi:hypothetical protein
MPKQRLKSELNTFIKGLNSDRSPLNYQPGETKLEYNFELNIDGSRDRRYGLDTDAAFTYIRSIESLYSYGGVNSYVWVAPDNTILYVFYSLNLVEIHSSTFPYSVIATLSLTGSSVTSITDVDGRLIIAGNKIYVATYSSGSVSIEEQRIKVRDVWGVEDGTENDLSVRPASITSAHRYNLQNQSWGIPRKDDTNTLVDPITKYGTDLSYFPSNTEQVWQGLQFQAGATPFERMYTNMFPETYGASPSSAKGYFIIDALTRGASRATALAANNAKYPTLTNYTITFPQDETTTGPTVVGSFAGRAWFAGFGKEQTGTDKRSPYLADTVFFSQLIKDKTDVTKCYSEGDPTSRDSNDLVDTDGGFIKILGMLDPQAMAVIRDRLVILAKNGVWEILGGGSTGFTATNYMVNKISDVGCIARYSVVVAEDKLFYFGASGINVVEVNQNNDTVASEFTTGIVRQYYTSIYDYSSGVYARNALTHAKGAFDPITKKVRWIVSLRRNSQNVPEVLELCFDMALKAFSTNRIQNAFVSTLFYSKKNLSSISGESSRNITRDTMFYHIVYQVGSAGVYALARYKNPLFKDIGFGSLYLDAEAKMIFGDSTFGDSGVKKQVPFLTIHMRRTETGFDNLGAMLNTSGCLIRTHWDWAASETTNKIGSYFQAYRPNRLYFPSTFPSTDSPEFEIATSRNKVRGLGRALAIEVKTEAEKDCRLVGWALSVTGNKNE